MKQLFIILFLITEISVFGQTLPIKWGKISGDDMNMSVYPQDMNAPAVILCDYGEIYFDVYISELRIYYKRHVRIKILQEVGLKYAHIEIPYISREKYEDIVTLRAQALNVSEKGKLLKSKVSQRNFKDEKIDRKWNRVSFTIPDAKVGSVIEYQYTIASLDFVQLDDWNFQSEIPTRWSELVMKTPEFFNYYINLQEDTKPAINTNEECFQSIQWIYKPNNIVPQGLNPKYYYQGVINVRLRGNMNRIAMQNVSAFPKEDYVKSIEDHRLKLTIHLLDAIKPTLSIGIPIKIWEDFTKPLMLTTIDDYDDRTRENLQTTPYPAGYYIYRASTWERLCLRLQKREDFGKRLIKFWNYKSLLDSVNLNEMSKVDKINTIYNTINQTIKWNKTYEFTADRNFDDILKSKEASSGEINLMLISLLQRFDIEAYPVLVRTTDRGILPNDYPVVDHFNTVLCMVKNEKNYWFLDATNPLRKSNLLESNLLADSGWVVKKKEAFWVKLKNEVDTKQLTTMKIDIDSTKKYNVQWESTRDGYFALETQNQMLTQSLENVLLQSFSQKSIQIDSATSQNLEKNSNSLKLNCNLNISNLIHSQNDTLSISMKKLFKTTNSPFQSATRIFPVEFPYAFEENYHFSIAIPSGFQVLTPENKSLSLLNNDAIFQYSSQVSGNQINIETHFKLSKTKFELKNYKQLQQFYNQMLALAFLEIKFVKIK